MRFQSVTATFADAFLPRPSHTWDSRKAKMKKSALALMILALLGIAGCDSDDDEQQTGDAYNVILEDTTAPVDTLRR